MKTLRDLEEQFMINYDPGNPPWTNLVDGTKYPCYDTSGSNPIYFSPEGAVFDATGADRQYLEIPKTWRGTTNEVKIETKIKFTNLSNIPHICGEGYNVANSIAFTRLYSRPKYWVKEAVLTGTPNPSWTMSINTWYDITMGNSSVLNKTYLQLSGETEVSIASTRNPAQSAYPFRIGWVGNGLDSADPVAFAGIIEYWKMYLSDVLTVDLNFINTNPAWNNYSA